MAVWAFASILPGPKSTTQSPGMRPTGKRHFFTQLHSSQDSSILCSQKTKKDNRARRLFLKLSASSCGSALAWHTFWQRWGLTNERTPGSGANHATLNVNVTNERKCWDYAPFPHLVRWNPLKTPDLHKLVAYYETLGGTSSWLVRNESIKESHVWIRS